MPAIHPVKSRGLLKKQEVLRAAGKGIDSYTASYTLNEDHFWSDRAVLFRPEFNVAAVQQGLEFAFERHPEVCFARNRNRLPFGCHAWAKWGREFWIAKLREQGFGDLTEQFS